MTGEFNDSVNRIIDTSKDIAILKNKGHSVGKSVLGRFGYLLVCQNPELLTKYPDLFLASSKIESSGDMILKIEKEIKK